MYEGRQIYFGPVQQAKEYFIELGYHCPDRQTTADFLTSLTMPIERVVREGFEDRVPRTPDEFAKAWKDSALCKELLQDISEFDKEHPVGGPAVTHFLASRNAEKTSFM